MKDIIRYVVVCDSMYGMTCIFCTFVFFYTVILFVVSYLYKCLCKVCNTIITYKDIHTKAEMGDVSIETDLHR